MITSNSNVQYWWAPAQGLYTSSANTTSTIEGATVFAKPLVQTTYTVTANETNAGTSKGYFRLNTIVVSPEVTLAVNSSDFSICGGDAFTLTATSSNGNFNNYTWRNVTQNETISGSGSSVTLTSTSSGYPYTNSYFTVTAYYGACVITAFTNNLNTLYFPTDPVTVSPNLIVDVPKDKICDGEKIKITASGAYAKNNLFTTSLGTYIFHPTVSENSANYLLSNAPSTYDSTATTENLTASTNCSIYGIIASNALNCSGSTSIYEFHITVVGDPPDLNISNSASVFYTGCSFTLTASNTQSGNTYYTWYPGTYLDKVTGASVTVTPTSPGTYIYYVLAENTEANNYGCCSSESIEIIVEDPPEIYCANGCEFCDAGEPSLSIYPLGTVCHRAAIKRFGL